MKKIIITTVLLTCSFSGICQSTIVPGDKSINKSLLKSESFTMGYSVKKNGTYYEIGIYKTEINLDNKIFDIKTTLSFMNSDIKWKDHFIADVNNFKPISSTSERSGDRTLTLKFSNSITGEFQNNKTGQKTPIKDNRKENYFDISIYPYLLKGLPLSSGYKAIFPVYDFEALDENNKFCNVYIKEVKSDLFNSDLTGGHKVWKISIYEESSKYDFQYYIDKETHIIWQINIDSNKGDNIQLKNKEVDFNPFQNVFNIKETLKLINNGSATIEGVAFARDNQNEGAFKGLAVINLNKMQFAPKGTTIVLMPYTPYFKEWMELNKKQEKIKNAKPIPLPKEAFDCFKFTTIYDNDGHFEFTNLQPGDYFLSTSFKYKHTSFKREVTGTSDIYIGGNYVGSNVYSSVFAYSSAGAANVQEVATIKKDGEKLKVKLKKTL